MVRLPILIACCSALLTSEPAHPPHLLELADWHLVDEVDLGAPDPGHRFQVVAPAPPEHRTIAGRRAQDLAPGTEPGFIAVRLGEGAGLRAGGRYLLTVDYPEDRPRSFVVSNLGCETRRGLHTGGTVGDALDAPYVGSHNESLAIPLSGEWRTWSMLFRLHPRYPERRIARGAGARDQGPAGGITVVLSQFAREHAPRSAGIAASHLRLYAAPEDLDLAAPLAELPAALPRRYLFWREEMADGVIDSRDPSENGFPEDQVLDWYRYKLELATFLGHNAYAKDLLEFGANQGWDSSRYGGNRWVYLRIPWFDEERGPGQRTPLPHPAPPRQGRGWARRLHPHRLEREGQRRPHRSRHPGGLPPHARDHGARARRARRHRIRGGRTARRPQRRLALPWSGPGLAHALSGAAHSAPSRQTLGLQP